MGGLDLFIFEAVRSHLKKPMERGDLPAILQFSQIYSTVTTLAKFFGLSGLIPLSIEILYAKY